MVDGEVFLERFRTVRNFLGFTKYRYQVLGGGWIVVHGVRYNFISELWFDDKNKISGQGTIEFLEYVNTQRRQE